MVAEDRLAVSALHYTAKDLDRARHPYELTPRRDVILCLDYASAAWATKAAARAPSRNTRCTRSRSGSGSASAPTPPPWDPIRTIAREAVPKCPPERNMSGLR